MLANTAFRQTSAIEVRLFDGIDGLCRLRSAWANLLAAVPTASIFSTWEWLSAWWSAFGGERKLTTFAAFDSGGSLVGIAPLSFETHRVASGIVVRLVRVMGDGSTDSDNLDLLVAPGYEQRFVNKLLNYLESQANRWDVVQFNTVPDCSPNAAHLFAEVERRNWVLASHKEPGLVIDLPDNWESYLMRLSTALRSKLRRYLSRMECAFEVGFHKCDDQGELPARLTSFFDLHQRRWQAKGELGAFRCTERRLFYAELSRLLMARRRLEFWFLELDGSPVAAEFDFRYGETVYTLQTAFDPRYSAYRPGHLLRSHLLQNFIEAGARHYDFLAGQEIHKEQWGGRRRFYRDIHFALPNTRGSVFLSCSHAVRIAKEQLRQHLPPQMWTALRRGKRALVP